MKAFCALWRCLGSGEAKADAVQNDAKAGLVASNSELKGTNDCKYGPPVAQVDRDSASFHQVECKQPSEEASPSQAGADGAAHVQDPQQALSLGLPLKERTLRVLLQKAKAAINQQSQLFQHPPKTDHCSGGPSQCVADGVVSTQSLLEDPELRVSNRQLLETCSVPRPDGRTLLRAELLLGELRRWLASRPNPAAATALLYAAGDGLAHAEHCIRSAGLVRFWTPDVVSPFLALLQLYGDLLMHASGVAKGHGPRQQRQHQREVEGHPQHQQPHKQPLRQSLELQSGAAGADTLPSPSTTGGGWQRMARDGARPSEGPVSDEAVAAGAASPGSKRNNQQLHLQQQQQQQRQQQHPLAFAVAGLLLRPDWLDLLSEALELLHFSTEYDTAAARAGRPPQEALSGALQLWAFLTQLAKFAAAHAESAQRMAACLQRLAALLAPPAGAVPRLLALPLREDTLAAQLHALWLLQVLYDMPDAKVLYHPGVADYYVALHQAAMVEGYEASAADPHSAAAELCRIHATLLRSLARQPGAPVRAAFARVRTAEWLLSELSLESQVLPCAQEQQQQQEVDVGISEDGDSSSSSSASLSSSDASSVGEEGEAGARGVDADHDVGSGGGADAGGEQAVASPKGGGPVADEGEQRGASKSFAFTYDLNEDVERLMALEDELGHALEVDGFEYDDEGRRLMARSDARQAEAAAAAAAFAAAVTAAAEAAAAAAAAGGTPSELDRPRLHVRLQDDSDDGGGGSVPEVEALSSGLTGSGGGATTDGGSGVTGIGTVTVNGATGSGCSTNDISVSRRSSNVPRLTLAGLRAASISSMAVRSMRSSSTGARRALGTTASRASGANSAWGRSVGGGETEPGAGTGAGTTEDHDEYDDDETIPEDAMLTPTGDPVAVAERIAHWSSTIGEDDSNEPGPGPDDAPSSCGGGGVPVRGGGGVVRPCLSSLRSRRGSGASAATGVSARSLRAPSMDAALEDPSCPTSPTPARAYARELTCASSVHTGPQGELHLMVPSSAAQAGPRGVTHGSVAPGHGKPPLPGSRPPVPPLRLGTGASSVDGQGAGTSASSASGNIQCSSRAGPPHVGSSRAMVLLSASNRAGAGVWAAAGSSSLSGQMPGPAQTPSRPSRSSSGATDVPPAPAPPAPAPQGARPPPEAPQRSPRTLHDSTALPTRSAPLPHLPPHHEQQQQQQQQPQADAAVSAPPTGTEPVDGAPPEGQPTARPRQPLIPVLNLTSLRRGGAGPSSRGTTTDTGRTAALSAMLRAVPSTNTSSLPGGSAMDSCASPPTAVGNRSTTTSVASGGGASASSGGSPPAAHAQPTPPSASGGYTPSLSVGPADRNADRSSVAPLERIPEGGHTDPGPPPSPSPHEAATYEELACRRLLYQDPATHLLLLKILLDLLVSPSGGLDSGYVPQRPADSRAPHAEYILLWHLNAPRNGAIVQQLCRGAARRAALGAASREARLSQPSGAAPQGVGPLTAPAPGPLLTPQGPRRTGSGGVSAPHDSARDYQCAPSQIPGASQLAVPPPPPPDPHPTPAAVSSGDADTAPTATSALARPAAVTRALRLLSRPLFDAGRYSNLQFVARGAYGGIYRARMELCARPPSAQADRRGTAAPSPAPAPPQAVQVVIKTIPLPGSPFDGCVLADVFGEVSIMERFIGHECICQLLDYGMHDDAYWIVMRRYRCSLAEWRARQRPLGDAAAPPTAAPPAVRAAACVYLSALAQVVEALELLSSHNVVHFDLKCSNVLIQPLPGVSDGELWAPVGGISTSVAGCSVSGATAAPLPPPSAVPFRCVVADFGEARAYRSAAEAFTARNRGTEVFKSPEMLLMDIGGTVASPASAGAGPGAAVPPAAQAPQKTSSGRQPLAPVNKLPSRSSTDQPVTTPVSGAGSQPGGRPPSRPTSASAAASKPARRHVLAGAGLASDIWSLGCLAYELFSSTVLFAGDYASVTHRVAFGAGERMTLTEAERARLGRLPQLVGLVEWILARDPAKRPSLKQIRDRIHHARAELAGS